MASSRARDVTEEEGTEERFEELLRETAAFPSPHASEPLPREKRIHSDLGLRSRLLRAELPFLCFCLKASSHSTQQSGNPRQAPWAGGQDRSILFLHLPLGTFIPHTRLFPTAKTPSRDSAQSREFGLWPHSPVVLS